MDFDLSDAQTAWLATAQSLGRSWSGPSDAARAVSTAGAAGLFGDDVDLLGMAVAVDALAHEHAAPALAVALQSAVVSGITAADGRLHADRAALQRGAMVGAVALSAEQLPSLTGETLSGRASWVAPLTPRGFVVVGAIPEDASPTYSKAAVACAARLPDSAAFEVVDTAGLRGIVCGHVTFDRTPCVTLGATVPMMAAIRILMAAAGLGMGRRALHEALRAAQRYERTGPGGEQTVQGLLADTATELDAAMLLTWKAATAATVSLAEASMAKLAATEATQRAVARATQVVGGDSFQQGHVIERLAQDVRALELFAGRTETLREAVAAETLP